MPRGDHEHTGTRIAAARKLAGLTQRGLAQTIGYSYSLVHQVESGHKPASPDLVAAVARALRLDVTALTGQPYVTELQQDRLEGLIRPIREALDLYDLGADPDLPVRPAGQLVAAADDLCRLVRAARLNAAATLLPAVIAELTTAAYRMPSTTLWRALGSTYRTAHDITVKLGYFDLSTIALDRMAWAADRACDPLLAAVRQYMRALVYHREGEHRIGLRLIASGHGLAADAEPTPDAVAVTGQLYLGASVIAARARDAALVEDHLDQAKACANRTGESSTHWLSFGPTNVACHAVSAQVELHHYDTALALAAGVELPHSWAPSRQAHFHIDRGRCQMETGRTDAALESITTARRLAPQQTRYHPGARETIKGLVYMRRTTPDTLDNLAAWIGL
ncbi:helix-turn-helix transcriptional regulator [Streptomyces sp. PA03-1a]|nr:helix-turn-helix transcriptional regulator [Streptomyces sp. PA03-1a]